MTITMALERNFFFDYARRVLFDGKFRQRQVDGLNLLLDYWDRYFPQDDMRWLAYALATVHYEVDRTMQPIREHGSEAYFRKMYDIEGDNPRKARLLGNIHPGDGARFCGRGFVQLTGRRNYEDWSARLDIDLAGNPDLALEGSIAATILFEGMRLGTFTGKGFADYFNTEKTDWINARRIVNHLDKANLIAGFARNYLIALTFTGYRF
ncbi:hypothetical protein [Chlorobium sp.]|uniref:hypothetical protein n=1 Tax=Chlorobium sp. TaxID=1095 RepID=UPI0025BD6FE0|nr:hypothetical protein [Chlorobium sp.]